MDCRTCQPTLIDLLHGELATDAAEEAHAHLQHCVSCRGAMDKLSYALRMAERLPALEPPQAVSARLLQLAEEKARAMAAQRKLPARKPPTLLQRLIDFVGRFAMARQVGMATIMALIVAVGLWSLPKLRREPSVAGSTVLDPDPTGEAQRSAPGVQPAAPLDLQVDLRAGRIRSKEEERRLREEQVPATVMAGEPPPPPEPTAELAKKTDPSRALDDLDAPSLERVGRAGARQHDERKALAEAPPAERSYRSAAGVAKGSSEAESLGSGAGPQAFPRSSPEEKRKTAASNVAATTAPRQDKAADAPYGAPMPAAPAPAPVASEGAVPRSASELYSVGQERARAGDPSGALQAFRGAQAQTTDAVMRRKAQLGAARATAEMQGCGAALAGFQQVVDAAPASGEAGEAMLELARCRTQRGEPALARALLERAARIQQTARRAESMLDAMAPATDVVAAPAKSAAAKPAAAAEPAEAEPKP